ncbi:MAG: M23 family metallopeptidase, partial [Candidatus Latescibacteria bacterium]|nr:M23 family metallopeptidase [Candidatus Latescibacterota bacterium]
MLQEKRHPIHSFRADILLTGGRYCNVRKAHRSTLPLLLLLLAIFFPPSSSLRSDEHDDVPWPIDAARRISSSFGEYRPGRFHMGLDLKSNGVTGRKVYALGDGYISRVRTSPFGYGKGLYIKLDSGGTVVYGHLSGFLPEIEDELFAMRIRNGTYDVDWSPTPDRYRVGKG